MIDRDIAYWKRQSETATTKEAALVAFGIYVGMRLAKGDYFAEPVVTPPSQDSRS